ncbi:hypothetical protein RGU73_06515 [Neobacillus cucumis]|nr:hypothetical protein [Neobacillus cucumis]MDR4946045.1 hypothetical protein [Neobacillus cucumis]
MLLKGVKKKENGAKLTHSLITMGGKMNNSQYVHATFY